MKAFTKMILLVHRYLGFALSLLFVVWFLSGIVMMYVKYPTMRQQERLQNLAAVRFPDSTLVIADALKRAGITDSLRSVRLGMMLDRPVYRLTTVKGEYKAIFADNGALFKTTDTTLAVQLASSFGEKSKPEKLETLTEIDQWMAGARSMGYTTPVQRLKMDDEKGTYIYVSTKTGEVVQRVNARQRLLAWLGPIPHWIYPTVLLRNRPLWNDIIIWTSSLGTIMCIAGIVMGFVRYSRKSKTSLAFSPYRKKWFRWHHYTGFVFGIFAFTWVFSGLLSMTPWDWAPFTRLDMAETNQWTGGPFNPSQFTLQPARALAIFKKDVNVKEIHLMQFDGKSFYLAYEDDEHTRLLPATRGSVTAFEAFDPRVFVKKLQEMMPAVNMKESVVLNEYDDYYYAKNNEKRLPVLRLKMDNERQVWYYVDLKTAQVVLKHEKLSRLERWLYHGLHSLDFRFIIYKRPLWDIIMIVLMLGGTAASMTGLVLTWKWFKRKAEKSTLTIQYTKQ